MATTTPEQRQPAEEAAGRPTRQVHWGFSFLAEPISRRLRLRDPADSEFVGDLVNAVVLVLLGFVQYALSGASRSELVDPSVRSWVPVFIVIACLPLAWRRRLPVLTYLVIAPAALSYAAWPENISLAVALFSAPRYVKATRWPLALGGAVAGLTANLAVDVHHRLGPWSLGRDAAIVALLWAGGEASRRWAPRWAEWEARQRAARLAEERRPLVEERARIARELHDVIAHGVSVMVVQAGAAETLLDTDPQRARTALESIAATGRQSLEEMRRLLGVLRSGDSDGSASAGPQPGLDRLEALVARTRQAGLAVDLTEAGNTPVPPSVELCAYRIVQEALTNVLKHSGASRVEVRVDRGPEQVEIRVDDDGRSASGREAGKGGHGLVGMRERVGLFSGTFTAGPGPDGGWQVHAVLPLHNGGPSASEDVGASE